MKRKQPSTPKYSSLEDMYQGMYRLLYAICGDYASSQQDREDILSIVWGKIAMTPDRYLNLDEASLISYLRVVIRNTAFDYLQHERLEREKREEFNQMMRDMATENAIEDVLFASDDLDYLQEACRILTEREQLLLMLRFYAKMKARDVAQRLECSEEAVRVMQHRILRKLREEITRIKKAEGGE